MTVLLGRKHTGGAAWVLGLPGPTGATSITGTDAPPDQIYQVTSLAGASAQVAAQAAYVGPAGTIQATVYAFGSSATIPPGAAWQTMAAASGVASGLVTVPRGGPYALTFKDTTSGVAWVSAKRIYAGDNGMFYGQSNMLHIFNNTTPSYQASQPTGRKQAGGGWNVITNAGGETFPLTPPTVFGGIVNPALGITGELAGSKTFGASMAYLAVKIIANTVGPFGLFPYAVAGTDHIYWAPNTGAGWVSMLGVAGSSTGIWNKPPYAFDAAFAVRYQGESSASAPLRASFYAALGNELAGLLAATGRTTSNFRYGLVSLGSTAAGSGYGPLASRRADVLAFIAANAPCAYYAGNPVDLTMADGIHLDGAGLNHLAYRIALTSSIALGRTVAGSTGNFITGAGPKVTGISRSGAVLTLTVGMDGSTALLTGDGGTSGSTAAGFIVLDSGGGPVSISSVAFSGASIVLTLASVPTLPLTISHQMADAPYGSPPVAAQVIYGNNTVPGDSIGAPLWPFAPVSVG